MAASFRQTRQKRPHGSTRVSKSLSLQWLGRPVLLTGLSLATLSTMAMLPTAASAQVLYGSLTGTVQDKTGAIIPGSAVTVTNQLTGEIRKTTANGAGQYNVLDVLPGQYTVSVTGTGFSTFAQKNIQVEVNRQVRVDVSLDLGSVDSVVEVTDAPAQLQTESGEVNAEITSKEIAELPITSTQGRSFQALYTLIPGAAAVAEQNSTASNPSRAESLNVNGTSYNGNTTRIDGAVNYYGWLPYLIAYVPPADSVGNVSITTNSFNAEQGQAGGSSIKITTKSGTRQFHGSLWEYYQDAAFNARGYTQTVSALTNSKNPTGSVPKNVFNQFGFNIGGPVIIPRLLTGRSKLFFFDNFERTTRRQLITGFQNVPDTNMINGNFSEVVSANTGNTTLYDPQPVMPFAFPNGCNTAAPSVNGYLIPSCRPSFTQEYGETGSNVNTIPTSRISPQAAKMIANLAPISSLVGTPTTAQLASGSLNQDYYGTGTLAYNRTTNDAKITIIPSDKTQIFGKYSIEPFSVTDPQELGAAGGGTFDGGQPGAASGRVQNVGMGVSHVFRPNLVVDADFGYTRQVTGAQSLLDISLGNYGTDVLGIPGTNGAGPQYVGQPAFAFNSTFSNIGDSNFGAPFLFRDNQFTGDVNLTYVKGRHSTKFGGTYYHFDLNHFQPTSGGGVSNVRGGFQFQGGLTCTTGCQVTGYNSLADFLLGLPNNGAGAAVQKAQQINNPNALRWSTFGAYAQDQWKVTKALTVNYGVRYEYYPVPYRDHTGVAEFNDMLPASANGNVEIGGVNGNPQNAGIQNGYGNFVPRLGLAYSVTSKTVIRSGFGFTTDPDSLRYLRDEFPFDIAPSYNGTAVGTIAVNGTQPITLASGIPLPVIPNLASGFPSPAVQRQFHSTSVVATWKAGTSSYSKTWVTTLSSISATSETTLSASRQA